MEDSEKKQLFEDSPLQRLLKNGTKNLKALNESDIVEDIIFTMQHYLKNYDFFIFEI